MQLLTINLDEQREKYEDLPDKWLTLGGRGLIAQILQEQEVADAYPLGPENKLILCNGPLAGTNVSCADRLSIGAKSPLTGGIKESNSGGNSARSLAMMGLRGVILEGETSGDDNKLIIIDKGEVRFESADSFKMMGNYELNDELKDIYGENYDIISTGPAGENEYLNSAIATTDADGRSSRMAARGGLGAVMGSKGIKAILISTKGDYQHPGINNELFKEARNKFHKIIRENDRVEVLKQYGTASTVMDVQNIQALPVENFSRGTFEGAENLSGENIHDIIKDRGGEGEVSHPCMLGCLIQCSNVYPDENGEEIVSPLEYETLGLIGPNLGIDDPDKVAEINRLCNEYGLDTIETGGVLGVMAEAGLFEFGEADKYIEAIKEVPEDGWLGRLIGMGTGITGQFLNVRRIPVVKNQCISAYDPRGVKGTGVTYATSPMGADHTAGLTVFIPLDHHSKEGQIEASRKVQLGRTAYDSLGLCVFLMAATAPHPDKVVDMLNGLYDLDLEKNYLEKLGKKTLELERDFNEEAGIPRDDFDIPKFFRQEPLQPKGSTWDFTQEELEKLFSEM